MSQESLSRRDFLGKSAAVAGAVTMAAAAVHTKPAKAEEKKYSANDRIRGGMIGIGIHGMSPGERALNVNGVEVVAACDLYDGHFVRAKEVINPQIATTKDYRELLARKDIDAVIISTPDHWHKQMAIDAMEAGKDVYLEKPATYRWEEGDEIAKVVKKTNRILQVGSQWVSEPVNKLVLKKIKNGEIGQVTLVESCIHRNTPTGAWYYPIPPDASPQTCDWDRFLGSAPKRAWDPHRFFQWRLYWDYSGGLPTDLFVHMIGTVHTLMGVKMANSVWATGQIYRFHDWGRELPDQMQAIAKYDNFSLYLASTTNNDHGKPFVTIYGTEGTIEYYGGHFLQYYEPVQDNYSYSLAHYPKDTQEVLRGQLGLNEKNRPIAELLPEAEPVKYEIKGENSTVTHLRNFFNAVRSRENPFEDIEFGHMAATVGHMCNLSYKAGREMKWDAKKRVVA